MQKIEYFWDISRQKYVMLMSETQEIKIVDKEQIKRDFYTQNPKGWKYIKDTLFLSDTHIKNRYLCFEPLRPNSWTQNGFTYQNTYIETQISQNSLKLRTASNLLKNLDFLSKTPHIKALLANLIVEPDSLYFFINWLAAAFVTRQKLGNTILFRGIQGTGKGIFWTKIIEYFIGRNYTQVLENDSLKSSFTPSGLEKNLFVLANEVKGDFRDGNSMYEKLKIYISDEILRIEEKGIQSFNSVNHFNMLFFSNNDVPLQIQAGDRRYTVFQTRTRTLRDVALEDFNEKIEEFLINIENERDIFLNDLCCFDFDLNAARKCLETPEKERIYRASMTKIEILADKIKNLDEDFLTNDIVEILEQIPSQEKIELLKTHNIIEMYINEEPSDIMVMDTLLTQMRNDAFYFGSLLNAHLIFLYKLFVDKTATNTKIGTALNTHFGQSFLKSADGIKKRMREVPEFRDKKFVQKLRNEIPF